MEKRNDGKYTSLFLPGQQIDFSKLSCTRPGARSIAGHLGGGGGGGGGGKPAG